MRLSRLFGRTLREAPSGVEVESHKLLLRGAFVRQTGAGIFTWLPLGWRVVRKVCDILREELEAIGAQEMLFPVVNPAEMWKATGRWYSVGSELARMQDRNERDLALAMTHEEAVSTTVSEEVSSYRDLPRLIYHIQTKWRDDPRPRAGLIRVREFTMKDSYSLDADEAGLDRQYRAHYEAYHRIFQRCGIRAEAVESDVGMMGGKQAHEFMYLTPIGEDSILFSDASEYKANRQVARFLRTPPEDYVDGESPGTLSEVHTPGAKTIAGLAEYLGIPESRTAKMVFMTADGEKLVAAVIRGDLEVNETKLANLLDGADLRPAYDAEIRAGGGVPGYAAPNDLTAEVTIVADESVVTTPNLVCGANREDYHRMNFNYGREFTADITGDIATAGEGHRSPDGHGVLRERRAVEVGNIFKLGTFYSEALGCYYLDRDGKRKPVIMGSYGIGVGRLVASIAEEHRDEKGLMWPRSVAPYEVHIVALRGGEEEAEKVYRELSDAGFEALLDDREESPGIKFTDADLIGIPTRITVSKKRVSEGTVELKHRSAAEAEIVPRDTVLPRLRSAP